MLSKRLSSHGFKVISTCLTKEGAEKLKKDVSLSIFYFN